MSDPSLSDALKEAFATKTQVMQYHTLEFRHPAISPPVRVVEGWVGINARLEEDAPEDASDMVEWIAFPFELTPPEISPSGAPRMVIEISNVSRTLMAYLELALESITPIKVTYRMYLDGNLDVGPENNPPMELDITGLQINPLRIRAECGFMDLGQKKFPGLTYSTQTFPGLIQQ
ncbi:MAG: DUF1833 family protein [Magnetococcales bacterium]|nr:DUF1833 family protein [Magnetococcales bacterium]